MPRYVLHAAIALLSLLYGLQARAGEPDLKKLRKQLIIAIDNSKTTDSLYKALSAIKNRTGLIDGYIAALLACKAKHSWNPYLKLKYLNKAEALFNTAVNADPHNIEIRFLRFSVEHNVPGFLGYNKNREADAEDMITQLGKRNYGTADKELTIAIIRFLLDSKRCSPVQNEVLNKYLTQLT